jgi:adenosylmethionine-8-amino-7-oxononanoate aminotransferase
MKNSYVYFLTNWNNKVLYIGVTNDLERRLSEHKSKLAKGFTEKYNIYKLVYIEHYFDIEAAFQREKQLKKWARHKKDALVAKDNPEWKDLSLNWHQDPSTALGMTAEGEIKEKHNPIWHPFTQHALAHPPLRIERAEGARLYAKNGQTLIDGISSWWVNTHGHCHPSIVKAVQDQAARLEQVIFAGFTHDPAEQLIQKLLDRTRRTLGNHLAYAFFSDSGSTAVEVALKMSIGYFAFTGQPERKKIVALEGGYHGDTFGTMAAGARGVFTKPYEPYLFDVEFLPFPDGDTTEKAFEALLEKEGSSIAALILEPLVQGAGGMKTYPASTLKALHDLCQKHGVLLIADEVMTGFGRTGTFFACEQAGISPDLLCLSKGLTAGFLPMGLTLANKAIYAAFYAPDRARTFFHSTSFTGNPIACAAALASLEIWDKEPVLERIHKIEISHKKASETLAKDPNVQDVRVMGSILALDIIDPNPGYLSELAPMLYEFYLAQGVLLRPIGNCVYILPPYCITEQELQQIYATIEASLEYLRQKRGCSTTAEKRPVTAHC